MLWWLMNAMKKYSDERYVFSFIQNHKKTISRNYGYYINSIYPSQLPLDSFQD